MQNFSCEIVLSLINQIYKLKYKIFSCNYLNNFLISYFMSIRF